MAADVVTVVTGQQMTRRKWPFAGCLMEKKQQFRILYVRVAVPQ